MVQNNEIFDILLVENSPVLIDIFKELARILNFSIKYASTINEYIFYFTKYDFRFVLIDIHIEYKFAGLFLSRIHFKIQKIKNNAVKMFFFSLQDNLEFDLSKLSLDDFSSEKFSSFYNFFRVKFPLQFFNYFRSETYNQGVPAIS